MRNYIFSPADILLPKKDHEKWSVIACDQFTSNEAYWKETDHTVGTAPSTLRLIYPEVYLGKTDAQAVTASINDTMQDYLKKGIFNEYPNAFIYVERIQSDGKKRSGLVGAVDLDEYDYHEGSCSRVRATEKTVLERIPPRVKIRENACLELPHILMLMDDSERKILEPLAQMAKEGSMQQLYDFDLMQGGGHLSGWLVPGELNESLAQSIGALGEKHGGITLAVGDGNHSLATAKACRSAAPTEQNRYALCELVNIHSEALEFEPIYRTVENVDPDALLESFTSYLEREDIQNPSNAEQQILFVTQKKKVTVCAKRPPHALAVGTVQLFLDDYLRSCPDAVLDYIHGEDEVEAVVAKPNACGFLYGCMGKSELFDAVEKEGVLPRKTFSMGSARDKRYYTEVRKIK